MKDQPYTQNYYNHANDPQLYADFQKYAFENPHSILSHSPSKMNKNSGDSSFLGSKGTSNKASYLRQTLDVGSFARMKDRIKTINEGASQNLEEMGNQYYPQKYKFSAEKNYENLDRTKYTKNYNNSSMNNYQRPHSKNESKKKLQDKLQSFIHTFDQFKDQLQASTRITQELLKLRQSHKKIKQQRYNDVLFNLSLGNSPVKSTKMYQNYAPQPTKQSMKVKIQNFDNLSKNIEKNTQELHKNYMKKDIRKRSKSNYDFTYHNYDKNTKDLTKQHQINNFQLGKMLGQGKFGQVFQAIHKNTGIIVALKKIAKATIKEYLMIDQFILQLKLQSYLSHPNILSIYHYFDDNSHIYLVLEYMEGGTLYSRLKHMKTLSESEVALKIRDIASAINYLHENCIAHRDIKPQNIVISQGIWKLCDFGWATLCEQRRKTYCGTFDYSPPEILEGQEYDFTVDLWCLGVLAYELLVGKAPFYHISRKQTRNKILNVDDRSIKFPQNVSYKARSFILDLLKKNPKERLSSDKLLQHPFFEVRKRRMIIIYTIKEIQISCRLIMIQILNFLFCKLTQKFLQNKYILMMSFYKFKSSYLNIKFIIFQLLVPKNMQQIKSELKALRERHEITIMELNDTKEDNQRLKKMNTTLVQNLAKQQIDSLTEIKLIIEGDHYRLKILELESELQRLNMRLTEQIQRRANQLINQIRMNQKKEKQQCEKCKKGCENCLKLQIVISEKNNIIDGLRLDLEEVKADLEIIVAKNKSESPEIKQLKKNNEMLRKKLEQTQMYMIDANQHHGEIQKLQDQWQMRYNNLNEQHQLALEELGNMFRGKEQGFSQTQFSGVFNQPTVRMSPKYSEKENKMMKEIQKYAGQIASKKYSRCSVSPIKGGYTRPNAQSRLMTDSNFTQFTIKDAINRPSQGTYFS